MASRRKSYFEQDLIIALLILFSIAVFIKNFLVDTNEQFIYLADSFLHGKLYFLEKPGKWLDCVEYQGKYYWHLGPFPALVLIPFVALFGKAFRQGYLQFFLNLVVFYLLYRLNRFLKFKKSDSLWLTFAFLFASVYVLNILIPYSWYFPQVITTLLYFVAIREYFGKKRSLLIGFCFAAIFATRLTAGLGVIFFGLDILFNRRISSKKKLAELIFLFFPVFIAGFLLLGYNYVRFDNIFDSGYKRSNEFLLPESYRFEQINYGLFKLKNIPTNFYYYFIKSLSPMRLEVETMHGQTFILKKPYIEIDFPGVSFFVISPFFLYFFRSDFKKKTVKMLLAPIVLIQLILLTYYWPGWIQMGPRYMLDFLPLAFLIVLFAFKQRKLNLQHKALIFLSACLNFYLFFNMRLNF